MTDRPIIFSGAMMRALLAGRKTQTRRLLSPKPSVAMPDRFQRVGRCTDTGRAVWEAWAGNAPCNAFPAGRDLCTPLYHTAAIGDRMYVRENWYGRFWDLADIDGRAREHWDTPKEERAADQCSARYYQCDEISVPGTERFVPEGQWAPSIHMPRWASRLTLLVEDVRIERLQEISETDAIAEGAYRGKHSGRVADSYLAMSLGDYFHSGRGWYRDLWDRLHGAEAWEANPWIVVLTFRVIHSNIDSIEGGA